MAGLDGQISQQRAHPVGLERRHRLVVEGNLKAT
jgi:hypothetical protein